MWIYLLVDMITERLVFLAISLAHCKYWVNHNQSSYSRKRSSKNQKCQPISNSFIILLSIKKFWDCHDEVSGRKTYSFWLLQANLSLLSLKILPGPLSQQLNGRTRYLHINTNDYKLAVHSPLSGGNGCGLWIRALFLDELLKSEKNFKKIKISERSFVYIGTQFTP